MDGKTNLLIIFAGARLYGVGHVIQSLAKNIDKERYDVTVLCFERDPDEYAEFRKNFDFPGVDARVLESVNRYVDFKLIPDIIKVIREKRINVIHSHAYKSDISGLIAARITGIPIVSTFHSTAEKHKRLLGIYIGFTYKIFRFFNKVVSVSQDLAEFLKIQGVPARLITVIPNGVGMPVKNRDIRKELGISEEAPVVGQVGRLRWIKGQEYFIKAGKEIIKDHPDVQLLMVGEGEDRERLEDMIDDLGLADNVRLLGYRTDATDVINSCNVIVSASLFENFPVTVLEAMSQGKPVVATSVGGVPEIIEDGKNGLLINPKDPEAIAKAVKKMLSDKEMQTRLGKAAAKTVKDKYSAQKMAKAYERLYEETMKGKTL